MRGPPEDFEAFCRAEWPRVHAALILLTGDAGTAEELAQETMIRVSAHWEKVGALESPGGWAHRVAVNLARSSWRREQAGRRARDRMAGDRGPTPDGTDPVRIVDDDLLRALAALPRDEREAVVLRFATDLSIAQVAAALHRPEGTVKTLTRRGLERLRTDLTPARADSDADGDVDATLEEDLDVH